MKYAFQLSDGQIIRLPGSENSIKFLPVYRELETNGA